MAIGDDALSAGLPLVAYSGEEGKVRYGAREINRTRDFVANAKTEINNLRVLVTTTDAQLTTNINAVEVDLTNLLNSRLPGKIERGSSVPANNYGVNGDIFLVMI